jgi:CRISPR/Cas system-associated exonuclease Cas4 (RecB family)
MAEHSSHRLLSYSEIETAMTCFARWDFAYGGRLAGSTLKARERAAVLSGGSAWGAAVAAWHQAQGDRQMTIDGVAPEWAAYEQLIRSLDADEKWQRENGIAVAPQTRMEQQDDLTQMLAHYMATVEPLPNLTMLEKQIIVGVPSRTGKRSSTRYRFLAKIDGYTVVDGNEWVVEFKLRNRLHSVDLIQKERQHRWYAWAAARAAGLNPVGVIVEERLNSAPDSPQLTKTGRVSHAKDQATTPDLYKLMCAEHGEEPKPEVVDALLQKEWFHRVPLAFRPDELEEAGRDLVTAAKLVRDLDSGDLSPVRNAQTMRCNFCRYRPICAEPQDRLYVDSLFQRTVPKRERPAMEVAQ